jgi:hypothetical protein
MRIYHQTPKYLEIRATDRQVVAMAILFGLALISIEAFLVYQFRYEISELEFPYMTGGTLGLLLILAGGGLLLMVSLLTTFYLSYYFDKELGLFCLTSRTLFRKTVVRRSISDIWQLWVDGDLDITGQGHHYIKIVMHNGEQVKIPSLGSTPIEREYHEYLANEIGEFLRSPYDGTLE